MLVVSGGRVVGGAVVGGAVDATVVAGTVGWLVAGTGVVWVGPVVAGPLVGCADVGAEVTLLVGAGALDDGALDGAVVDSVGAVTAVVGTAVLVGAAVGDVAVVGGGLTGGAADSDPSVAAERPARADPVMAKPCGWAVSPMAPRETWIVSVAPSATATVRMANHAAPAAATVCLACLAGWLRLGMSPSHQVDAGPHRRTANPSGSSAPADQQGGGNRATAWTRSRAAVVR